MNNRKKIFYFDLLFFVFLECAAVFAQPAFQEDFSSGDISRWSYVEGNSGMGSADVSIVDGRGIFTYRTSYASLNTPISGEGPLMLSFKWKMNQLSWSGDAFVLLMNDDMTKGYGAKCGGSNSVTSGWQTAMTWSNTSPINRGIAGNYYTYLSGGSTKYFNSSDAYGPVTISDDPMVIYDWVTDDTGGISVIADGGADHHGVLTFSGSDPFSNIMLTKIVIIGQADGSLAIDDILIDVPEENGTCQDVVDGGLLLNNDFNGDCYVDLADLFIFLTQWLRCNDPQDAECESPW